jgi:hypothetical protein
MFGDFLGLFHQSATIARTQCIGQNRDCLFKLFLRPGQHSCEKCFVPIDQQIGNVLLLSHE